MVTKVTILGKSDNLEFKKEERTVSVTVKNRSATINGEFKIKELKFYIAFVRYNK